MWEFGRASDEEGLRLIVAYLSIQDPALRSEIMELAEAYAKLSFKTLPVSNKLAQDNKPDNK